MTVQTQREWVPHLTTYVWTLSFTQDDFEFPKLVLETFHCKCIFIPRRKKINLPLLFAKRKNVLNSPRSAYCVVDPAPLIV